MTDPLASYAFLPWVRRGVANEITREDGDFSALPRARAAFPVTLHFNDATPTERITAELDLYGPGDIAGIDPRMIVRVDPPPDFRNAEPNYFPLIEFDQPDFPWRYTPASAGVGDRLRPWLVLIVLAHDEFEIQQQSGVLPRIAVTANAPLPKLDQSWAWAHAQITGADGNTGPEEIDRIVREEPQRVGSRLLCPRYLRPNDAYSAFLVPAFECGRLAGLNQPIDDDDENPLDALVPAWTAQRAGITTLPSYYQWEFHTGEEGDFESLVRRLLPPTTLPASVGMREFDASNPGAGLTGVHEPDGSLILEGALMSPASRDALPDWNPSNSFINDMQSLLNAPAELLSNPSGAAAVAPPLYGRWHAARDRLTAASDPSWFDEINRDPRWRSVAGLGARVLQAQQHQLLAGAWDQVDGVVAANKKLRETQLGCALAAKLIERDFLQLEADSVVQITAPVLARIMASPRTIYATLKDSPIADGTLEPQFRQVTRPRGPIGRKQARLRSAGGPFGLAEKPGAGLIALLNAGEFAFRFPPPKDRLQTIAATAKSLMPRASLWRAWSMLLLLAALIIAGLTVIRFSFGMALIGAPLAAFLAAGAVVTFRTARRRTVLAGLGEGTLTAGQVLRAPAAASFVPVERSFAAAVESDDAGERYSRQAAVDNFKFATANLVDRIQVRRSEPVTGQPADLRSLQTKILSALDPQTTIAGAVLSRLHLPAGIPRDPGDCGPVMAAPEFGQPMYEPLRDLSQEWLLPGVGQIPPDTVSLLESNQRFIESYLLGLNHEMARELLWHEYPTDQRGTYFRQFWDPSGHVGAPQSDLLDITAVPDWVATSAAGSHRPVPLPEDGHLVLLIRGRLLQRYPNTAIYAARATLDPAGLPAQRQRIPTEEHRYPLFHGTLAPDIVFLGFELGYDDVIGDDVDTDPARQGWFFILEDQPGEPRFGLDAEIPDLTDGAARTWNDLAWPDLVDIAAMLDGFGYIDLDLPTPENGPPPRPHLPAPPTGEPNLAWHAGDGSRASDIAYITAQSPYRVAIHGSDMLPPRRP